MLSENSWNIINKKKIAAQKENLFSATYIPLDFVASYLLDVNISIGKKSTRISLNGVPA